MTFIKLLLLACIFFFNNDILVCMNNQTSLAKDKVKEDVEFKTILTTFCGRLIKNGDFNKSNLKKTFRIIVNEELSNMGDVLNAKLNDHILEEAFFFDLYLNNKSVFVRKYENLTLGTLMKEVYLWGGNYEKIIIDGVCQCLKNYREDNKTIPYKFLSYFLTKNSHDETPLLITKAITENIKYMNEKKIRKLFSECIENLDSLKKAKDFYNCIKILNNKIIDLDLTEKLDETIEELGI